MITHNARYYLCPNIFDHQRYLSDLSVLYVVRNHLKLLIFPNDARSVLFKFDCNQTIGKEIFVRPTGHFEAHWVN